MLMRVVQLAHISDFAGNSFLIPKHRGALSKRKNKYFSSEASVSILLTNCSDGGGTWTRKGDHHCCWVSCQSRFKCEIKIPFLVRFESL